MQQKKKDMQQKIFWPELTQPIGGMSAIKKSRKKHPKGNIYQLTFLPKRKMINPKSNNLAKVFLFPTYTF